MTLTEFPTADDTLVRPVIPVDFRWTQFPARILVFDLDDTLAPSKSPIPDAIANGLAELLEHASVCVISGGRFEQFDRQVIRRLRVAPGLLPKLHLMPTCGTQYYRWAEDKWTRVYSEDLNPSDKENIKQVLIDGARHLGLWEESTWGEIIEDRGSQITFSALGQRAPVDKKSAWDPDGSKKSRLRAFVAQKLPGLEVRSGGSTSIDVTRKGIDKAYGIHKLLAQTGSVVDDLLFIGDRLDVDGNDYPVRRIGVRCVEVSGWEQTAGLLETLNMLRNC
jgi:phosphomannomutase